MLCGFGTFAVRKYHATPRFVYMNVNTNNRQKRKKKEKKKSYREAIQGHTRGTGDKLKEFSPFFLAEGIDSLPEPLYNGMGVGVGGVFGIFTEILHIDFG